MDNYDSTLKCIFIGDPFVGKTSFCNKLIDCNFPLYYQSTIGVDFFTKILNINNRNVKLQIWDTAGQEKYKSIISSFYRNSLFVLFLFDLNNETSFINLKKWYSDIEYYCGTSITKVLIGNKTDLKQNVSQNDIDRLCYLKQIKYYSCCIKHNG